MTPDEGKKLWDEANSANPNKKSEIVSGFYSWVTPDKSAVKFTPDPNGKFNIKFFKYNFFQRLLIKIGLMRDKRYDSTKFIKGVDPYDY